MLGSGDRRVVPEDPRFIYAIPTRDPSSRQLTTGQYRGCHIGTFIGVPPSGAQIEMHSIDIWRVRAGRLQEHWDELNSLEFFQQIGAIPTPN